MSRQELLEKSVNYLEKMTPERVEEVFHYIEYLYFRYEKIGTGKNENMLLLDFYGKGKEIWNVEPQQYVNELRQDREIE